MKKFIKASINILIIESFILSQIAIANDSKVFYNSEEYQKIINNKLHIKKVIKYSSPEGGIIKDEIRIEKALKEIESLKNIKKTDMAVCDADWHYVFKFDDGTLVKVYFEGQFLHYNGQNYEIKVR